MDDRLRSIQEYVYAKYIDGGGAPQIDEVDAARFLEEHYGKSEHAGDPDCFYPGMLYFELGYEMEEHQSEFFQKAKYWLERYKALSGGEEWDAIDDRLADVDDFLESAGIEFEGAGDLPAVVAAPITIQEIDDHGPMMRIDGGTFIFGKDGESRSLAPYFIDKFSVTNREYEAFCRATGYRFPKYWGDKRFNNPLAPVVGVSLADAQKYSRWVGKQLPTEEQWEKACRGTDGRELPWGEDEPTERHASFGRDPAEGSTESVETTTESTSPYGVRDLMGNVWEWTLTSVNDGETVNVIKGGCYNDEARFLFASLRLGAVPKDKFETIGFRCVKNA